MRKILWIFVVLPMVTFAQDVKEDKVFFGEVKSNLFDLVVGKTVNLGFEKYLKGNQSLQLDVNFFDTFSYIDASYMDRNNLHTAQLSYNIYFSDSKDHYGFLFYPFLKGRTGSQSSYYEIYNYNPETFDYTVTRVVDKNDLSGFEAGFGLGHKWVFNQKISLFMGAQIGRDFTGQRISYYYSEIDFKAFLSLGFRL
jgi:hypothetical protein